MTKFTKYLPLILFTALLMTCAKEVEVTVEPIEPEEQSINQLSEIDGLEYTVEPYELDFDALIREIEADVDYYESDEFGARGDKQARIDDYNKQSETIRQSIISIIDNRARRGHLYADWSIFKAPYKNYYQKSRYDTPVYFNSKSKRDWNVDFAISILHGWFASIYELNFLEVKLKQLWTLYRSDGYYNCEELAIIKKIKRTGKWKGYGDIGFGINNDFDDRKIKHKGELLDLRSAKLKLFATNYVKILIDRATPPNLTRDVLRQTFYDANKNRVPTDAELLKWKLTWKLGWWTQYNTDGTIATASTDVSYGQFSLGSGKRKMIWYDGLNYKSFTRTELWDKWEKNCKLNSNGRTIQHAIPYCAEPYYESVEKIKNTLIRQVKDLETNYPERLAQCVIE